MVPIAAPPEEPEESEESEPEAPPAKIVVREPTMDEMIAKLSSMGLAVVSVKMVETEVARSIVQRLQPRGGLNIYQSAAYSIDMLPRSALESILPKELVTLDSEKTMTWRAEDYTDACHLIGDMLLNTKTFSADLTHGLKKPSEKHIYSLATILPPIEISHHRLSRGVERTYINFEYVLSDDAGHIHAPKDSKKREKEILPEMMANVASRIDATTATMLSLGYPLAAGFFRRTGTPEAEAEAKAAAAAAKPKKGPPKPPKPPKTPKTPKTPKALTCRCRITDWSEEDSEMSEASTLSEWEEEETFNVAKIVAERRTAGKARRWFVVEWEGYSPEWETWRQPLFKGHDPGKAGEPVQTWAALEDLPPHSAALHEWRATHPGPFY